MHTLKSPKDSSPRSSAARHLDENPQTFFSDRFSSPARSGRFQISTYTGPDFVDFSHPIERAMPPPGQEPRLASGVLAEVDL